MQIPSTNMSWKNTTDNNKHFSFIFIFPPRRPDLRPAPRTPLDTLTSNHYCTLYTTRLRGTTLCLGGRWQLFFLILKKLGFTCTPFISTSRNYARNFYWYERSLIKSLNLNTSKCKRKVFMVQCWVFLGIFKYFKWRSGNTHYF